MLAITKRSVLSIEKHLFGFRFSSSGFSKLPLFKSSYSLDKIYPKTDLNISTSDKSQPESNDKQFSGYIPVNKLTINYCKSGGPGGQHVNTTNTKVTLQFHLSSADWIPTDAKQRLAIIHKNNINKDGFWIIRSDKTRAQSLNLADCMDKLRCFVTEATKPIPEPSFETLEMIRERKERAAIRRLQQKRGRSLIKSDRNSID